MQTSTRRSRLLLGAAMAALLVGAAVGVSAALNKDPGIEVASAPGSTATALQPTNGAEEPEADDTPAAPPVEPDVGVECAEPAFEDYEPTAEELEATNADSLALAELLESAGIDHEVITDELGFSWVEYDYQDGIVQAVVNSYYRGQYPDESILDEPIPVEELEFLAEENDALVAALDAAGVAYERMTDEAGFEWIEWDYEDATAQAAVEEFYTERYPAEDFPPEELEFPREENDALAAELDAAGVAYERMTDEAGFEWIEWDYEDADAQAAVDAYYGELYGDCYTTGSIDDYEPTQQEIEASDTETEAMAAAFEAAGVAYTIETDDLGFRWIDWDYEDESAQAVADEYWRTQGPAEISADLDRLADAFDGADIAYVREGGEECETMVFDIGDSAALAVVASL